MKEEPLQEGTYPPVLKSSAAFLRPLAGVSAWRFSHVLLWKQPAGPARWWAPPRPVPPPGGCLQSPRRVAATPGPRPRPKRLVWGQPHELTQSRLFGRGTSLDFHEIECGQSRSKGKKFSLCKVLRSPWTFIHFP